jgi:fructose-1,6-bisphosphatase/inositol monophosphatase family enzyme
MPLDGPARAVLDVFHQVADAVAAALAATVDWGESGHRTGQYLVDLDADQAALPILLDAGYAVLSEESGRNGPIGAPVVVVDPLDGSTNASRSIAWYATSLCLVDDHGASVALVADQASGARYWAARGQGAYRNGNPIHVSGCTELHRAVLGISGLPASHYGWAQFRAYGAAALDLCMVACGAFDAFVDMVNDGHGAWDYLGGMLLVTEAGGSFAEVHRRSLVTLDHAARRSPVAAATPELLDAILAKRRR